MIKKAAEPQRPCSFFLFAFPQSLFGRAVDIRRGNDGHGGGLRELSASFRAAHGYVAQAVSEKPAARTYPDP